MIATIAANANYYFVPPTVQMQLPPESEPSFVAIVAPVNERLNFGQHLQGLRSNHTLSNFADQLGSLFKRRLVEYGSSVGGSVGGSGGDASGRRSRSDELRRSSSLLSPSLPARAR